MAVPLLDYEFDMRVVARDAFEILRDEDAGVGGGGAVLAEFKDELAYGWDERGVTVGGCRAQPSPQQSGRHGGRQGREINVSVSD